MTKARSHVAWTAGARVIDCLKPVDKAVVRTGSKPPGRNESERRGSLERPKSRSRAPLDWAKAAPSRKIGICAWRFRRGDSDSMAARMCNATGETLPVPWRNLRRAKSYNRHTREKDGRREGVGWVHSSDEQAQPPASEGALRTAILWQDWEAWGR
jgi:hypothetical protein